MGFNSALKGLNSFKLSVNHPGVFIKANKQDI